MLGFGFRVKGLGAFRVVVANPTRRLSRIAYTF